MENIIYILFFSLLWTFILTLFVLFFLIKWLINKILQIEVIKKAETFKQAKDIWEKDISKIQNFNNKVEEIKNKDEINIIKEEIKKSKIKTDEEKEEELWVDWIWENYNFKK